MLELHQIAAWQQPRKLPPRRWGLAYNQGRMNMKRLIDLLKFWNLSDVEETSRQFGHPGITGDIDTLTFQDAREMFEGPPKYSVPALCVYTELQPYSCSHGFHAVAWYEQRVCPGCGDLHDHVVAGVEFDQQIAEYYCLPVGKYFNEREINEALELVRALSQGMSRQ